MIRLAIIAPASSTHTVKWINEMAKRNYLVTLFSLKTHRNNEDEIDKDVKVIYLNGEAPFGYYLCARQLKEYLNNSFDVVNAHYASGYGTLARLAKAKPLLLNVWGSDVYDFPYQNIINKTIISKNLMYADKLASTSHIMAEQVIKLINIKKDAIIVTPFGVDVDEFRPLNTHVFNKKEPVIGIIKTLSPKYGVDTLIKAVSELNKLIDSETEVKLEIYGKGEQLQALKSLANELGISRQIKFNGFINHTEVPKVINTFDVFVGSSDSESFGVSLVEAMACEVPVVATDVDGFKEVVDDKVTGFIVPRKNPKLMAKALNELLFNNDIRVKMGKDGRKRVIDKYRWQDNADILDRELIKLVNNTIGD